MNLFSEMRGHLLRVLDGLVAAGQLPPGLELAAVTVEPPRDPAHGDFATNAAMVLAKPAKLAPRVIAEKIVEGLKAHAAITSAEIAGPGFINIRVKPELWRDQVKVVLEAGIGYGQSGIGGGKLVNVEYVSANPTGPLHVGHCRGAVFGDALAALLEKAGYKVCREYYINDAGAQVDVLARSAHLRYREALGDNIGEIPAGLYPGDYLVPVGKALAERFGDRMKALPEAEWLPDFRKAAIDAMMIAIREDLAALNIKQDVFSSERELHVDGRVEKAFRALEGKGLIYEGVLEPPKGKKPDDWEPRPQTLFKATGFGDDVDRPLKKSDGSWTYFAADIAYHFDKVQRGFDDMIDVWGADHGGYIKRVQAAVKALTDGRAALDVKICQLVNLLDGGQPVKMSKRAGSFVTLRDVVDQVGRDVVRFIMLTRKNDAALDFDFKKVTEQSKDNPVFYVQYAHARCHSLFKRAGEEMGLSLEDVLAAANKRAPARLDREAELGLLRLMAQWPRMVESAAIAHEPHRIAFYLYDLASAFHGLWTLGNDDPKLRFVVADDRDLTLDRLALVRAVQVVIASGLAVMGVTPIDEMR